jgi:hypothetical protein
MGSNVEWHQFPDLIQMVYSDVLFLDTVQIANERVVNMMNESPASTIHILVDISQVKKVEFQLGELFQLDVLKEANASPKLGWILYYDRNNAFYNFIVSALAQSSGSKVRMLESQQEALDFLRDNTDSST